MRPAANGFDASGYAFVWMTKLNQIRFELVWKVNNRINQFWVYYELSHFYIGDSHSTYFGSLGTTTDRK